MKKVNVEKLKEIITNKKVLAIGGGAILGVIILICVLTIGFGSNSNKLEKNMKDMGVSFYENFYWKQVGKNDEEKAAFLKKYKSTGIKVSLDVLERTDKANEKKVAAMVNNKSKKSCDKANTKAIIYPKEPYGQKDYKIEIVLDCGNKK